jgi:hypothetical protein
VSPCIILRFMEVPVIGNTGRIFYSDFKINVQIIQKVKSLCAYGTVQALDSLSTVTERPVQGTSR